MIDPYENIYIGNFIFALGYQAAQSVSGLGDKAVQLVQQTPDEGKLNDLFVNWSGRSFIFEFKRDRKAITSELRKEAKRDLNAALNDPENIRALSLSRKGHFLGFGDNGAMFFMPYSMINDAASPFVGLNRFCAALVKGEHNFGLAFNELQEYLAFIGTTTGSDTEGCGGFILGIGDDGSIFMTPFESVKVMSQSLSNEPTPPTPRPRSFEMSR